MDISLGLITDIQSLNDKDVLAISSGWSSRTTTDGHFHIGTRRSKLLQAFVHWAQDFRQVLGTPSIVGLNETTFKDQLTRALERAVIRKTLREQTSTASEAANLGPLDSERK